MSIYKDDAARQLKDILKNRDKSIAEKYIKYIKKIFNGIYAINLISSRIELRTLFDSEYFKVSISCLLESFSLLLDNYPRGSSLVLRSSLENFIKFIIECINKKYTRNYNINYKSYSKNKKTVSNIISDIYENFLGLKSKLESLNGKMETEYRSLSALSHSLTNESKTNVFCYFSDLNKPNIEYLDKVVVRILNVVNHIFTFITILCKESFIKWDSKELKLILRMVLGIRKTETIIKIIKNK